MLEGERLACDGRECFTHVYYVIGIGPSIFVNDSSARGRGPFYLVSMPGEVKDPTQGVNV